MLNDLDGRIAPKVLIIDDDRLFNGALARAIKKMGYDAENRFCLQEGYDEAISNPYDVIYLDVRLPDGNGLEALPIFRKIPSSPEVIIVTGFAYSNGADRAYNQGAWWYIRKPATMKEYTLPLVRALEHRSIKPKIECAVIRPYRTAICVSDLNTALRQLYKDLSFCRIARRCNQKDICIACVKSIIETCAQLIGKNVIFPKPFQRPPVVPHLLRRAEDLADKRPTCKVLNFQKRS